MWCKQIYKYIIQKWYILKTEYCNIIEINIWIVKRQIAGDVLSMDVGNGMSGGGGLFGKTETLF